MRNVGEISDDTDDGAPLCTKGEFKGFNWNRDDEDADDDEDDDCGDGSDSDSE